MDFLPKSPGNREKNYPSWACSYDYRPVCQNLTKDVYILPPSYFPTPLLKYIYPTVYGHSWWILIIFLKVTFTATTRSPSDCNVTIYWRVWYSIISQTCKHHHSLPFSFPGRSSRKWYWVKTLHSMSRGQNFSPYLVTFLGKHFSATSSRGVTVTMNMVYIRLLILSLPLFSV